VAVRKTKAEVVLSDWERLRNELLEAAGTIQSSHSRRLDRLMQGELEVLQRDLAKMASRCALLGGMVAQALKANEERWGANTRL
jgi:hypothetical protein